jgi:Uma2 family endonuclease
MALMHIPDNLPCASYEDLENTPDGVTAEIIFGVLMMSPRPGWPHTRALYRLGISLGPVDTTTVDVACGDTDGWVLAPEPELRIAGDAVVPDMAGWRRSRLLRVQGNWVTVVPDWVCEVLSPSTARRDFGEKATWYHQQGVRWYWVVDPRARAIRCHQRAPEGWLQTGFYSEHETTAIPPLDSVPIQLGTLWE